MSLSVLTAISSVVYWRIVAAVHVSELTKAGMVILTNLMPFWDKTGRTDTLSMSIAQEIKCVGMGTIGTLGRSTISQAVM